MFLFLSGRNFNPPDHSKKKHAVFQHFKLLIRKNKGQKYRVKTAKTTFFNYIFPTAIRVAVSTLSLQQTDNI